MEIHKEEGQNVKVCWNWNLLGAVTAAGGTVIAAATAPSFSRASKKFQQVTDPWVGASNSVPERKVVSIKALFERDEEIPEEEAVCKFCFGVLVDGNMVKIKCKCKIALAHDACESNQFRLRGNNECEVCGEEVKKVPVTLLRVTVPARPGEPKESFTAKLKRLLMCCLPDEEALLNEL